MDTQSWPWELASRCLKTNRQKKRAQKTGKQKDLIQLFRSQKKIKKQIEELPWIPLTEPYQRGWKRSFVLREDVARSEKAAFYQELLPKINTVLYSVDKRFYERRGRFGKRVYQEREQFLRSFKVYAWHRAAWKLTDFERSLFRLEDHMQSGQLVWTYVFSEPWRFVLKVEPNMITKVKLIDQGLEQKLGEHNRCIRDRNLWPVISRMRGSSTRRWLRYYEKPKYANPHRNRPLHQILGDVRDDAVEMSFYGAQNDKCSDYAES